jgi:pyrroloquinoline-quinone synthase
MLAPSERESSTESWSDLLRPGWLAALDDTPFLLRCRRRVATRAQMRHFVCQQFHYAQHFTRYLNALLANLTDAGDRRALMQNLFEEMGFAAASPQSHAQIYLQMMEAMGLSADDEPPSEATRALVDTMFDCCSASRPLVGLGALCLGAEAVVPHLYRQILAGFEGVGERPANLAFFLMHIEADDDHALTMQRIIRRELRRQPNGHLDLDYGAGRAIAARVAFFRALG